MHTLTHPVRSTRGLTVSPGARVRLLSRDRKARTALISVVVSDRAADSLRISIPASDLRHLTKH